MAALQPPAAGLEAPDTLPHAAAAISAEASGLGGTYSVTLIATSLPEPVNSPEIAAAAANPASDLGTFSTIVTTSTATAARYLRESSDEDLSVCAGTAAAMRIAAEVASTCPTALGPAVNWQAGAWRAQVDHLGGAGPALRATKLVMAWLATHALPASTAGGLVAISVPGTRAAGAAVTAVVVWAHGSDIYQVRAAGSALSALSLAVAMAPWARRS